MVGYTRLSILLNPIIDLKPFVTSPVIILVNPQMGENIGAAARVMLNFGIEELRIVAPRDGWPNPQAVAMAVGAAQILENARIFDTTADAIADIKYLYAITARTRGMAKPLISAREISLNQHKAAFMFGAEKNGLSNYDVTLANKIISIPANPDFPSLNLAQAVAIICYEISIGRFQISENGLLQDDVACNRLKEEDDLATKEDLLNFFNHLESALDKTGFFRTIEKRPEMVKNLRNIFTRTCMSKQEVRTLRGIISSLEHI